MTETTAVPANPNISSTPQKALWKVVALTILLGIGSSIGSAFLSLKITFLYKDVLHLNPSDVGTLGIILGIPSYLQPFIGAWVDIHPFLGYHRRSYYVLSKILSVVSIGLLVATQQYHYVLVAAMLMLNSFGGTVRAVIISAFTVAVGNVTGTFGRLLSLGSLVPILMSILFTSRLSGYVAEHWSYQWCFGAYILVSLAITPLFFLIDERRVEARPHQESEADKAERLERQRADQERTSAALREALRSPGLWVLVAFVFYLIVTPGTNLAQIYFMTDVLHIDKQTIGDLGQWSSVGSLVAIGFFALISRSLPAWSIVWGAWLMDCLGYPLMLLLHDVTSAKWLSLAVGAIGLLYGFCLSTLAARLCPPGTEGTIYGLVQAAIVMAGVLSDKFGGWLYVVFGPETHHTIQHGWNMSQIIGLSFTVLGAVFIPFLPAWTRSKEPLRGAPNQDRPDR